MHNGDRTMDAIGYGKEISWQMCMQSFVPSNECKETKGGMMLEMRADVRREKCQDKKKVEGSMQA